MSKDIIYQSDDTPGEKQEPKRVNYYPDLDLTLETNQDRIEKFQSNSTHKMSRKSVNKSKSMGNKRTIINDGSVSTNKIRNMLGMEKEGHITVTPMPDFIKANETGRWPKKTNIRCHWCTLRFDTVPLIMPKWIDGDGTIHGQGCYHSFNCILADITQTVPGSKQGEIRNLTFYMMEKVFDRKVPDTIIEAPDKRVMVPYGGELTADEYLEIVAAGTVAVVYALPPLHALVPRVIKVDYQATTAKV